MKGLLAILGGAKGKPAASPEADSEAPMSESGASSEQEYARLAFDALKDDDADAFAEALTGAIRACMRKSKSGGYEDEATDDDE